jgi:hypothetical protein
VRTRLLAFAPLWSMCGTLSDLPSNDSLAIHSAYHPGEGLRFWNLCVVETPRWLSDYCPGDSRPLAHRDIFKSIAHQSYGRRERAGDLVGHSEVGSGIDAAHGADVEPVAIRIEGRPG